MVRVNHKNAPIHYQRKHLGLKQWEYAEKLRIHRVTLAKLERYAIWPGEELRTILAGALNTSPEAVAQDYGRHFPSRLRRTA